MEFLNPDRILSQLKLKPDMVAAEFGCGSRGFVISLAKKLKKGLVYGLDIQEEPLSVLKSATLSENISNIRLIRCDLEQPNGSTLADSSLDLVLIPNVFFQSEDKGAIISEAGRILKKRGELVIIDWLPEAEHGPIEGRISPDEMKKIAEKDNFKLKKEINTGKIAG